MDKLGKSSTRKKQCNDPCCRIVYRNFRNKKQYIFLSLFLSLIIDSAERFQNPPWESMHCIHGILDLSSTSAILSHLKCSQYAATNGTIQVSDWLRELYIFIEVSFQAYSHDLTKQGTTNWLRSIELAQRKNIWQYIFSR